MAKVQRSVALSHYALHNVHRTFSYTTDFVVKHPSLDNVLSGLLTPVLQRCHHTHFQSCAHEVFLYTIPMWNKKAANRKGLAAHDRSVSYSFYGLSFLYILISMGLYFLQYGFQSSDEVIHILLGQYQWREDTEDVGAGATGEAVLLVDELAANFLVRNIEYGTYH